MTVQNFWLDQLLMASVSSTSSFWGGLSGSFSITNSGSQSIQGWSFQFVSKYNDFDFYNADQSAVANNDGTYTITVQAAAGAAPLSAGASLDLGFTVTSESDQEVTLAETVLVSGAPPAVAVRAPAALAPAVLIRAQGRAPHRIRRRAAARASKPLPLAGIWPFRSRSAAAGTVPTKARSRC